MESSYKRVGDYIQQVDVRNSDSSVTELIGVSISKTFMESVANTIGTDLSKYKVISKGQFACSLMQVSRDGGIAISLYKENTPAIMSPAYYIFEVNSKELLAEYLELVVYNPMFDREAVFNAIGGVRGTLSWEEFCDMKIKLPPIEEQQKIVRQYKTITDRIEVLEKINKELENVARLSFSSFMDTSEETIEYKLSDIAEFTNGYSYTSDELQESDCGMATIKNFDRDGGFKTDGYKSIKPIKKTKMSELNLFDVVIACTDLTQDAAIIGNTEMILSKGGYNSLIASMDLVRIDSKIKEITNYLMVQIMRVAISKETAKTYTKGTTVLHFDKKAFENEIVKLPADLGELLSIEKIIKNCYLLIAGHLDEKMQLIKLRDKILSNI